MNYKIEGDIDFYKQLNEILNDNTPNTENDNSTLCLISRQKLENSFINLPCNHSFNYIPLYNEIIQQKNTHSTYKRKNLSISQIKCPYCRTIHNSLIPYIPMQDVEQIRGINHPSTYCMKYKDCSWKLLSGKKKGNPCNKNAFPTEFGDFCVTHFNYMEKKKTQLSLPKCIALLKSGKRKGEPCKNTGSHDGYCKTHFKMLD
jgi:hypothetical protein